MQIRPYRPTDEDAVVALWEAAGLVVPWNDPRRDIARKLTVQPELFVVGEDPAGALIATAMGGFDGHRGWIYYLAVADEHRGHGHARALLTHLQAALTELGCPTVRLMVRTSNTEALDFYDHLGWESSDVAVLGRRLIADD